MASKALEAGFSFLIWREALSSEEPVGGASGFGVMDGGAAVSGHNVRTERGRERRRWKQHGAVSLPPTESGGAGLRIRDVQEIKAAKKDRHRSACQL